MAKIIVTLCLILLLNSCSQFTLKYKRDLNHKTVEAVYNNDIKANQPVIAEITNNIQETELVIDRKWLLPADRQKAEAYLVNLIKLKSLLEYQSPETLQPEKKVTGEVGEFTKFVMDLNISQENQIAGLSKQQLKLRLLELKAEFEYLQRRLK